ncbi:MAG: 23S rRNA (uracil(1939)-C(5))-methyltransferase RlmD [Bacteroidetes bacterium]|uniref:23S rRNA (Uracil(1939)-C(5))-methyltransferase RlmD n=1 Tax=Candidatus Cryptobacteroides avicola TaxID=2840757 RepID=A0A940IIG5_9BACT|nr:23S rRNA (uracil(1939)-C(5))-methyltransferase RlmD [Candidatus Cryptobacteroides avicola]
MSRKKQDIILENVLIESVAAEGKALARVDGTVLFVPFAVPGDVVDVKVTKKKKNYMEGFILRIVTPSEHRIEPFCSHFGICGGCKWQPLPYQMQLQAKQQQVYDQLVRIGHLDVPEISPIIPSGKTEYYRNKLEFTFSRRRWIFSDEDPDSMSEAERCGLGFHVGKFFDKVLDIKQCYLQKDPSDRIRLFIKEYALEHGLEFFDIREHTGFLRNMFIRTAEDGSVMLIVCFYHEDAGARCALLDAVSAEFPQITSLYYVINGKANDSIADQECVLYKGEEAIYEYMEGLKFKIGPKSFYQTNTEQAYRLYSVAREYAALTGHETVYDLYTGTGTIAQFVSSKARKVIGIEYVPEAIADAKENARANGITNCDFYAGDMKDILTDGFVEAHGKPDVVILDPPRAGIHPDVAEVILNAEPARIVYVSCNPASQARDLAILSGKYSITAVQPVDMFPHTHHVENVVRLDLKEAQTV